ncbi:MAG: AbrB/MazE/SpoVT family DNA-binding domain-containing protein [Hydrogenophaga sp.]|uniref:AbrB/MazE/SpoVT family DNA-binding domain-containing protein n=1 Tax=Hydrogenophaga sp. TaxID=1904254 RepID=UPI0016AC7E6A|nr:type II toxin-antitoxin system PrlF family antitoxin [Hydrogenophaga sp.]NIM41523.1 AbrB/MazE/SpoVT family DNA-binding domain-containing protein [Hydrogenophaga sp.]NIN26831.1 AbrB/MazE/SpoVT family DNA-binding domain-containing protein [Hydrogenophaga sp.]NIN31532.1 AbrB/MazE/SpoVT family DNA-binding domain-containing protein [Hydrogenophaga sp.]NIN55765.1 AbrB/MazE/SpoVT family DNA-binding domain-containing protein [Hydrogenophaga sp.]NIO51933.1 AbrB/MazE/SpoVT family DNA-binding domain-c
MYNATLTSKGQTTIPKEVREGLGLQPHDQLNFTLMDDGTVIMRAKRRGLKDLAGIAGYKGKPIPAEQLKAPRRG